ncbi:hypothetical protein RM812_40485 [Streptomyces sp. DSM 40712]|uniref:Uncharacterized protein n=1 Tax=Streptomyces lancefieldiae TaxID=3075520 RepID=A0ABU3B1P3_9ACTN|nr:hypothetical protein [Streptomyces sp. DSM 40712]MDT0616372.1 hypothetical protein [Streptomyces sp. DSM 40712]
MAHKSSLWAFSASAACNWEDSDGAQMVSQSISVVRASSLRSIQRAVFCGALPPSNMAAKAELVDVFQGDALVLLPEKGKPDILDYRYAQTDSR